MIVSELESALFERFPRADAEAWDHVGLSIGDPNAEINSIFVALDATVDMVYSAHAAGANVLLSHHPVYIKAPDAFAPHAGAFPQASAAIYAAAKLGINVLSFHTNLDRSVEAQRLLPSLMGLDAEGSLEHPGERNASGLGSIAGTSPLKLEDLARAAARTFSTEPRVWGDLDAEVTRCAFLGGSLGDFGEAALRAGAEAIVTGEASYHVCQDLAIRGVGVILLGHDASEYPFTRILADAAYEAGIERNAITCTDVPRQWWTMTEGGVHEQR